MFVDRPFEIDFSTVELGAGAAGSVARLITSHARLEVLKVTGKSRTPYSFPLTAHSRDGNVIARALIYPASWTDADSVIVTSLTLAGQAVSCDFLPAVLRVGYNHAPAHAGAVSAAAKAGDVRALQAALDAGGSTEEADEVRGEIFISYSKGWNLAAQLCSLICLLVNVHPLFCRIPTLPYSGPPSAAISMPFKFSLRQAPMRYHVAR